MERGDPSASLVWPSATWSGDDDTGHPHHMEHEDGDHHLLDVCSHHDHCLDPWRVDILHHPWVGLQPHGEVMMILVILIMSNLKMVIIIQKMILVSGHPHHMEPEDGDHHLIDVSGYHDHCPDP